MPRDDGYEALLTVEFHARAEATEVVVVHERLPKASIAEHDSGWTGTLDKLAEHLKSPSPARWSDT